MRILNPYNWYDIMEIYFPIGASSGRRDIEKSRSLAPTQHNQTTNLITQTPYIVMFNPKSVLGFRREFLLAVKL